MTLFWITCAALLVVAILFVAVPLWRGTSNDSVLRDTANLEILRDQIVEMTADMKNGLLTPELHEQGKRELEERLLEEVGTSREAEASNTSYPLKVTAVVLAILLPLASVGLYLKLGNPEAFKPAHGALSLARTQNELKILEENVARNPGDPEALVVLARSYVDLGRYADGSRIYENLVKIIPDEPVLWVDYADALAMTNNSLRGKPTELLNRALELDPNNGKSLALSGSAAMERGDYQEAIRHWDKLLKLLPEGDTENATMIEQAITQAKQGLAHSKGGKIAPFNEPANKAAAAGKERITGTVTLSAVLKGQADPNDTLFVLARAAQGPKMPLAIIRKQVKDLPLSFSLDDSMAMQPEMKMSNFDRIVVVARISKAGNAAPQSGDLMGMSKSLALGSKGVKIDIDQTVR